MGLGYRGPDAVRRMLNIPGARVTALCDADQTKVDAVADALFCTANEAPEKFSGAEGWKSLCDSANVDLVYIAVPWKLHARMAVYAMEHGKHAAVEVPAATTVEECFALVQTSRRTGKQCAILENCIYDNFQLTCAGMAAAGKFGEVVHVEAGYTHCLDPYWEKCDYRWRLEENRIHHGDLYSSHGLGPAAKVLGIGRNDRLTELVSMDSAAFHGSELAQKTFGDPSYANGDHTVTLIRTERGKMITLHHNICNPQPYRLPFIVTGTAGYASKSPVEMFCFESEKPIIGNEVEELLADNRNPIITDELQKKAAQVGGHGGMDYIMDWRLIHCLLSGEPLDEDALDAAVWSSIAELSELSISRGSAAVEIPDFRI